MSHNVYMQQVKKLVVWIFFLLLLSFNLEQTLDSVAYFQESYT